MAVDKLMWIGIAKRTGTMGAGQHGCEDCPLGISQITG